VHPSRVLRRGAHHLIVRNAFVPLLKQDDHFLARKMRSETAMGPCPEREMPSDATIEVDTGRVRESLLIAPDALNGKSAISPVFSGQPRKSRSVVTFLVHVVALIRDVGVRLRAASYATVSSA
jgi:hypothetical protein